MPWVTAMTGLPSCSAIQAVFALPMLIRLSSITPSPVHSLLASVSATVKAISALGHADAALRPSAPPLPAAEPPRFLLALAFGALAGAIGNADPPDAHRGFGAAYAQSTPFGSESQVRC